MKPIGVIRTPFKDKRSAPIQPVKSKAEGRVVLLKKYEEGLDDIEGFSHIILLYIFNRTRGYRLKVKPYRDNRLRGVFATRHNRRPNRIGLSVVKLIKRRGNVLYIKNIDALDRTPLIDIKPYVPEFEPGVKVRVGWRKKLKE